MSPNSKKTKKAYLCVCLFALLLNIQQYICRILFPLYGYECND